MQIVIILFSLFLLFYVGFVIFVAFRFRCKKVEILKDFPCFSVIIPFRNEAILLPQLLNGINSQILDSNLFEVILIDDHSTDDSFNLIERFETNVPLKLIKNNGTGKKEALLTGIKASQFDVIITLDADVELSNQTFRFSISEYISRDLIMMCGLISLKSNQSLFQNLQKAESAAIVAISQVMLNHGLPSTCNGAHMVFDKKNIFRNRRVSTCTIGIR
jgi:poly-beta-1,6-N-acetyl-D-glucosamine synthase